MNAWDGTLRASRSKVPLNLELIRFATREGVPLDFVSWHLYGRLPSELRTAKETYERELRSLGVKKLPEFVVSEWSIGGRGTRHEATAFAETMLGLYRAGIDLQTGAPWQEFKPQPDPGFFSPWGMITQQGWKKPMFHTHRLFDRLARDSRGVTVLDSPDATSTVIVSREADDIYELIYWDRRYERRLASAIETLRENGLTESDLAHYGTIPGLEQAIETSSPKERRHRDAFVKARRVFEKSPQRVHTVQFDFQGMGAVEVLASRNVGVRAVRRPAYGTGNRVVADRAPYEVMWLRVRASSTPLASGAFGASDAPTRSGAPPPG